MTPAELKAARRVLGLSARGMAAELSDPDDPHGHRVNPRTVRRWEAGGQNIPGPVIRCVYYMLYLFYAGRPEIITPDGEQFDNSP